MSADSPPLVIGVLGEVKASVGGRPVDLGGPRQRADEDTGSFWDEALAIAHTRGSLFSVLAAHLWRGHWAWLAGDLLEAQQSLLAANEQNVRWGGIPATGISYGEAFLIELLIDRGAYADARAFYEQVRPRPRTGDGARLFDHAYSRLLLAEGDPAAALAVLDRWTGALSRPANPAWFAAPALRARALHALGRTGEARAIATDQVALARRRGAPTTVGRALLLAGELGDGPEALAALRESAAVLAGTRSRLHHARALAAVARALPPGAERVAAWRAALELADTCGAQGMRRDIAAQLTRAGVPVPPPAPAAPTATQRRIAAMAAEGIDERGIAEALFLTPAAVRAVLAGDLK